MPFAGDEAAVRFMTTTFDIDLDASRIAVRDGEPVGLANLGVRDTRGWVGGIGVVTSARRQGIGEALMNALHDEARARGLREVWLEVIEENEAAYELYRKLGYEDVRWVEIGVLDLELDAGNAREVSGEEAQARVRGLRTAREPWQRENETLAHYEDLRGLATNGGAAVYRVSADGRVILLQLTGDEAAARGLLASLRAHGPVTIFNVPSDDVAFTAFRTLGGRVTLRQREMRMTLA